MLFLCCLRTRQYVVKKAQFFFQHFQESYRLGEKKKTMIQRQILRSDMLSNE